jgi:hypothetical protein
MAERPLSDHLWDSSGQITSTGSTNAYVIAITEQVNGYYQGMPPIRFKANFANSGAATANIVTQSAPSGLGAKTLKKNGGANDVASGDIASGGIYTLSYDGTNFQVLELNGAAPAYRPGGTDVAVADGGTGASDAAGARSNLGAASVSQTDFIAGVIEAPDNQDYRLVVKIPYGITITETTTRSASGTCTATFKINTTALGGTANSVSSSEESQAHASNNVASANDDIVVTVSSNSTCVDMSFTIVFTRTLS